jgi:hypothetical protein
MVHIYRIINIYSANNAEISVAIFRKSAHRRIQLGSEKHKRGGTYPRLDIPLRSDYCEN